MQNTSSPDPSKPSVSTAFWRDRKPLIIGASAVALVAIAAIWAFSGPSKATNGPPPAVPVTAILAEQRDAVHSSNVVGTVESLHHVTVRTQIDGILTAIHFKEGELVAKGALLASIDDRTPKAALEAAEAQLARDQALLKAAELDLTRYQTLLNRGAISKQIADQQLADTEQLRASVRLNRANVETAKVNLSYTKITSPVAGRVGIRRVDAGNLVRTSDQNGIVSVSQINPISIVFPISQSQLSSLQTALQQPDGATVEAMSADGLTQLGRGTISALDNTIDPTTGTKRVRAIFDNTTEQLSPGSFVAVQIRTGFTAQAVVLPTAAVRPGLSGSFVYRIENETAQRVPVKLGYSNDDFVIITDGISAGDTIVSDGHSRLSPGAKVSFNKTTQTIAATSDPRKVAP